MSGPGRGGNLTQPLKKVLINEPNADNLGAYLDNQLGVRVLQFKQHGYSLPANGNVTISVQQPQAHAHKMATFALSNLAPADAQNYNYGLTILQRVRKPGIDNSKYFPHQKFYGGVRRVTAAGITNAELEAMTNDILNQINSDTGLTRRFDYELPGAAVVARRIPDVRITLIDWIAATAGAFQINGAAAVTVGAEATIGAYITAINDAVGLTGRILASANPTSPTDSIIVTSIDPTVQTLRWIPGADISADTVDNTAMVRYFDTYDAASTGDFTFPSPSGDVTITVGAVANRNAFVTAANTAVAAEPLLAGRVQFSQAVDGAEVIVHCTDKTITDVTYAAGAGTLALNAAENTAFDIVYAAAWAAQIGVLYLVNRWVDATFEVKFTRGMGDYALIRQGNFALLTNEDVQQVFSHIPNDGFLAQERRKPNLVLPGVDYVKVNIDIGQAHYDLGGASHSLMFITAIEVYMPATEWNVVAAGGVNDRWATVAAGRMMDEGTNDNIADLLVWWQA